MQKILILAALPDRLRLDREIREIEEAIKRAVKRDSFEIKIRTAVRPQDIRRAIADEKPEIVHFCGHGEQDGSLRLEDDGGNNKLVSPESLASLFNLHTGYVNCVLLNACYSSKPAEAISKHINYVIGMNQPIEDRAAIVFAQGFYDGLGYDNVNNDLIQRAFEEGIVAIELENLLQGTIPSIWKWGVAQCERKPIREFHERSSNRNSEVSTPTPGSSSDRLSSNPNEQEAQRLQRQREQVETKISADEHKFDGRLVITEIKLYKTDDYRKFQVELTIGFGTPEVKIPINSLFNSTIDIKFGLKNGELCFNLKNGLMPLNQRKCLRSHENNWMGTPLGLRNSPVWEFKIDNKLMSATQLGILNGFLENGNLGIIELLKENEYCELEAIFKISINRNYIKIIDLDDGTNKKQKETKIGLLLKYLKNELDTYVSKVVIRYDTTTIS